MPRRKGRSGEKKWPLNCVCGMAVAGERDRAPGSCLQVIQKGSDRRAVCGDGWGWEARWVTEARWRQGGEWN